MDWNDIGRERRERAEIERRVYVIGPPEGPVKIGFATWLPERLVTMQSGSPVDLILHASAPGGREDERVLHRRFAADRLRGEWFTLSPRIRAFIDDLRARDTLPERVEEPILTWRDLLFAIGRPTFRQVMGLSDASFTKWVNDGVPVKRREQLLAYAKTTNFDVSELVSQ